MTKKPGAGEIRAQITETLVDAYFDGESDTNPYPEWTSSQEAMTMTTLVYPRCAWKSH